MNPILIDFSEEIYTERLFIRKPMPGDGKMVYESIKASLKELKPWMPWANREQSEEEIEANIREANAKFLTREDLRLHIFNRGTGEFVGATGLHRMNWDVPKFEIGYWIDTRQSSKGYIMESTQAIIDFAFRELNAKRVEIRCDSRNRKSRAIPEKLGFTLEGILINDGISADRKEIRDTCIYAKIK